MGSMIDNGVTSEQSPPPSKRATQAKRIAEHAGIGVGALTIKIVMLCLVDAIALYAVWVLFLHDEWLVLGIVVVITILINWIYFSKRMIPAKYLTPGLVFLAVFQLFVLGYTAYIGFTNYGTGHIGSKDQAIGSLLSSALERVPDSPTYKVTVVDQFGEIGFLVTEPDGDVSVGTAESPLQTVTNATVENGKAVALDGYTSLTFTEVLARSNEISSLAVPFSDDPNDGALRSPDGSNGYLYTSWMFYDEVADSITNLRTGVVYSDIGTGAFTSADGRELLPGWQVPVGFDNFVRALTDESIRGPLVNVTIWTFVFAGLSVATTFFLGLFLAIVFNDMRMRGRRFYRVLMILPYAFPSFLSALVWAGMMNGSFGFINQVLLGGASVPWLTDPWLAKVSVLIVNLWLGFPYMFLVCMGALQSIPEDITEAAKVDGARPWGVFRYIKLPLLLVTVAPLLISSFAFNFNNFNLIYMLTDGGPRDTSASITVGHTDILISMVYKVAFTGQLRDYGLASAFTIIIFVVVAAISIISFQKTKSLEELNG